MTITDTAGAAVDVSGTTTGSNVSSDQFSNFPTQRTVQGLYTIAPTVTRSGLRDATGRDRDPSVAGSSGPENNYILDGVNTTDPAFGGSGANLPFEFVQEVEIKTGAYGPEYGRSTGGIFNVITKSGGNEFHGDIFGYGTTKGLVREVKNFPFTGSAANGFSEVDLGGDIGGPIVKDKLWFFGAFNPQKRKNYYLTQTFHTPVENDVTIPFYAGKITWAINPKNTFTASTFGDFTKIDGFLATLALTNVNGFGDDITAFEGLQETGGHNYAFRLNSTITNTFIAEFSGGLHFQRANTIPRAVDASNILDNFAVLRGGNVLAPVSTGVNANNRPSVRPTRRLMPMDSLIRAANAWAPASSTSLTVAVVLCSATSHVVPVLDFSRSRIATAMSSTRTCRTSSAATTQSSGALSGVQTATTSTLNRAVRR